MPILKRRLDICGRERTWEYLIESTGRQFAVSVRQIGHGDPTFKCSCGVCMDTGGEQATFFTELMSQPCIHIAEAQRDLSIARQAAAQMIP